MATAAQNDFITATKAYGKDFVKANEEKSSGIVDGTNVCEILGLQENTKKTFEARLSKIRHGADKNKDGYISLDFNLITGKKGLPIGDYIGIQKSAKPEARAKKMQVLMMKLEQLGADFSDITPTNVLERIKSESDRLTGIKPHVILALSKYVKQDGTFSVNINIVSSADTPSEKEEREEAVAEETPIDLVSMGQLADNGDEDATATLTQLGEDMGLDVNDGSLYATWEAFAEYALAIIEADEGAAEAQPEEEAATEEYDEEPPTEEEVAYYESCVGYPGTFTDADDDTINGTATAYDVATNSFEFEGDDGTGYTLKALLVTFDE